MGSGELDAKKEVLDEILRVMRRERNAETLRRALEIVTPRLLAKVGADALVISISGSGGMVFGTGAGVELLLGRHFESKWACYLQTGFGVTSPSAGVNVGVGLVWNAKNPEDYAGAFVEASGGAGVANASVATTPKDSWRLARRRPLREAHSFKIEAGIGTPIPHASALLEYYVRADTEQVCWQLMNETVMRGAP